MIGFVPQLWGSGHRIGGKMRRVVLLVGLLILVCACGSRRYRAQIEERMDPLMGQPMESVLLALGPPEQKMQAGSTEVWRYYKEFGSRTVESRNLVTGKGLGIYNTWTAYQLIDVIFVDSVAVRYKYEFRQ